jgi:hypothetical protein
MAVANARIAIIFIDDEGVVVIHGKALRIGTEPGVSLNRFGGAPD